MPALNIYRRSSHLFIFLFGPFLILKIIIRIKSEKAPKNDLTQLNVKGSINSMPALCPTNPAPHIKAVVRSNILFKTLFLILFIFHLKRILKIHILFYSFQNKFFHQLNAYYKHLQFLLIPV